MTVLCSFSPLPLRPQRRRSIRADENGSPTQADRRLRLAVSHNPAGVPSGSPLRNVSTASSDSSVSSNYDDGASYSSSVYSAATAVTSHAGNNYGGSNASQAPTLKPLPEDRSQSLGSCQEKPGEKCESPSSLHATVGELRRMNSQVSTVSSVTPTGRDSPTLTELRGGGFSPSHQGSSVSGTKNYLNMAPSPAPSQSLRDGQRSLAPDNHSKSSSPIPTKTSPAYRFKNTIIELRMPVIDVEAELAVAQRNKEYNKQSFRRNEEINGGIGISRGDAGAAPPNMVFVSPSGTSRPKGTRGAVWDDTESVESLGLYDEDGFLLSSPVRGAEGGGSEGTSAKGSGLRI